jgi:hypothetical protein
LDAALALSAYVLAFLVYPVVCDTVFHGRSLGKRALGLRVVRDDGGPLRFRHAFVRGLVGFVLERPGITFGTVAVLSSMIDARGRRIGDILAGTVVVQERVPAPPPLRITMPPLAAWASTLDLAALPAPLLLAARQCLARWPQLTATARERLAADLANQVAARVTPPPPLGTPAWAYLMAVLAEQRRRDGAWAGAAAGMPAAGGPATAVEPAGTVDPAAAVGPAGAVDPAAAVGPAGAVEPAAAPFAPPG